MVLLQEARQDQQSNKAIRCLVLGLDNAGKSSVVAKFFDYDCDEVAPTVGFEIKTRRIGELLVDFWDVGGQTSLRPFWSNYFHTADALIWVVDSADQERLHLCAAELKRVLKEEKMVGAPVLILANKQDMKNAADPELIEQMLDLSEVRRYRQVSIRGCSALSDDVTKVRHELLGVLNETRRLLFPETAELTVADLSDSNVSPKKEVTRGCYQVDWDNVNLGCDEWDIDVSEMKRHLSTLFRRDKDDRDDILALLDEAINTELNLMET